MTAIAFCAGLSGCAQIVVGTDPANGVTYNDHGAEADVRGDSARVSQASQTVLQNLGYQTSFSEGYVEGRNGNLMATVRISRNGSGNSHVEVLSTVGKLCSNMDYAGQVLQDIVLSK